MKFSYTAVWDDTVAMIRSHASLITAIAGVFIFLPSLLFGYFVPDPEPSSGNPVGALREYLVANAHWLLLSQLISMIGIIAILILLLGRDRPTVGGALGSALMVLPFYILASIGSGMIIFVGLLLFIIPALYLWGRLAIVGPIVVAEGVRNPIEAISRSFSLTKGSGWAITGLVLIISLAGMVIVITTTAVLGSLFVLVGGADLGKLLMMILSSAISSLFSVLMVVLMAAIYQNFAIASSPASTFD